MRLLPIIILVCFTEAASATSVEVILDQHTWKHRLILIFSPDAQHPATMQQKALLDEVATGLAERDLQVIEIPAGGTVRINSRSTDSPAQEWLRRFRVSPNQFRLLLIGKDGGIKLDQSKPEQPASLFRLIDAMPMRQEEMRRHGP